MTIHLWNTPVRFLIRRSMRYLLVSHGFRFVQAVVVLAALSFALTGSRIAAIDRYGNRADIVASIFITIATIALLTVLNRRVKTAIDRRFFREAYDAELILTELSEAIPTLSKTKQLVNLVADKLSDALHPENVTIFLDDDRAGAYVAALSSDVSKAGAELKSQRRSLVLHYDGAVIRQLRAKPLNSMEFSELDPLSAGMGMERDHVSSDHESQTLRVVRASLLIPIASNGRLHGLISLGRRLSDLPYANEDERLLLVVARQIAIFIENMKLISRMAEEERVEREFELAAEVQRHLFPADGLEDGELEIYGTCLPALGVGGDYYDYFDMGDGRTGIAIADVAGKGIAAALLTSTVQASLRCQVTTGDRSLTDVVSSIDRLLQHSTADGSFVTFFFAEFDRVTNALTYVNAGHNPPMLIRGRVASRRGAGSLLKLAGTNGYLSKAAVGVGDGVAVSVAQKPTVRLLTTGGPIIGTFLNERYEQEMIQLRSGDILAIYTDGVTEAVNPPGVEFGEERLRSILLESLQLSARESVEQIIARVLEWQGHTPQHDDITLIVMKVK
ncbi:MAG TPA: GAF domain-containing SpoIIE family protein phosphatase [Pyrinomonadaceae bacterium]|nr:GAF domain-containing SpoIIE family protein phosphatase [Pyrinomonadaceae bacterium]